MLKTAWRTVGGAAIRGGGGYSVLLALLTLGFIADWIAFAAKGEALINEGYAELGIVFFVCWAVIFLYARRLMRLGCQRESFF